MIHSMAGGDIKELSYSDYAKVEILEGEDKGKNFWYKSDIFTLKEGDKVLVPLNNFNVKAKVIRVDKNVSSQVAPFSLRKAKSIIKVIK